VWFKEDVLEKSKLAQHSFEEGHEAGWNEPGLYKFKLRAGIGTTSNQPVWCV
jgi:hypothetical protein